MDIIEKIKNTIKEEDTKNNLRKFNQYYIEGKLGSGQQGIVLKIKNNIDKRFALKIYRPTDKDPEILKDGINRFIEEINILATLNHKNIVKIYTGGTAKWSDKEGKWDVKEGFENFDKHGSAEVLYYYIMDYIGSGDISSIFPELKDKSDSSNNQEIPPYKSLKLFEDLISQIADAMYYYQSKGITHKDIKPKNILFCNDDSTFVIVDFGFARHIDSTQDKESIPRKEYLDTESIVAEDYKKNDMGQFSRILMKILPKLKNEYDSSRYQGIESVIEKGYGPLSQRFGDMLEFNNAIKHYFLTATGWKFELKLNEYLAPNRFGRFDSKLRIPVSGSLLLSKEIRSLIDTPEFQRLRGVRQLGPTMFVFPGANNTRFEHSLGTYSLALKYLEKLLSFPTFKELCDPLDKSIKLIALSALLHDIGHYPYSHWIEEIDDFPRGLKLPKHEERARKILSNGKINNLLEQEWDINVDELSDIIAGKHICNGEVLINSFLSSVIDVDKLDYLMRDSVHCGINYGKGIDLERLLDSLYVNSSTKKICLTTKGRSSLLSILSCRNIMYQEVYWHKTVRSSEAMFKRFFYEYVKEENDDISKIEKYLQYSDDQFIATLYERSKKKNKLNKLISPFAFRDEGRLLYKPAYIFYNNNASKEPNDTKRFFRDFINKNYKEIVDISDKLAAHLKESEIPDIEPFDIILEKTPIRRDHEIFEIEDFQLWNTRKESFEDYPDEINPLNQYLSNNQQAYIFCNPKYYNKLRKLVQEKKLDKILGEIL
ncbi:Serine/threonine-protein kinase PknD [uncultured archaeon]|nr:Serine/threonine-protein kinase PknD [uncultured archaeon]